MQKIFPDETEMGQRKPLIHFPLPQDLGSNPEQVDTSGVRKRPRSSSPSQPASAASATKPVTHVQLTQEDRDAVKQFIEYGNQSTCAAEYFRLAAQHHHHLDTPAQLLAGTGGGLSRSTTPAPYQWCTMALRHAQSLLCRIIQLDTAGFYLQSASPAGAAAAALAASHAATGAASTTSVASHAEAPVLPITTLELYCRFQALELELEDVLLRVQSTAQADGVPEAIKQQARADLEATVRCVEDSVNGLEATLVEMLLHLAEPPAKEPTRGQKKGNGTSGGTTAAAAAAAAAKPSIDYVAGIVRGLPEIFQSEQWPARVVCDAMCDVEMMRNQQTSLSPSSSCALRPSHLPAASTSVVAALLKGENVPDAAVSGLLKQEAEDNSSPTPAVAAARYRAQVSGATTSIALQSLLQICQHDVWNVFGVASASPISRLAALEKLRTASSVRRGAGSGAAQGAGVLNSLCSAAAPTRPALDLTQLAFREVLIRAWNHGYGLLGLRRLRFEMQALFYQYTARLSAPVSKANSQSRATRQELYTLWCQWDATLSGLTRAFMKKIGGDPALLGGKPDHEACGSGEEIDSLNACARMRQHATPSAKLSDAQAAALRVLTKLQAVDTKGWFAVPAFDLVNVDFTSVRYWMMSPSFAHKSRREAYRSLCRVLERMVDCCVQKYGPTHAFSDVITNVRQQLVDVARAESLL